MNYGEKVPGNGVFIASTERQCVDTKFKHLSRTELQGPIVSGEHECVPVDRNDN